MKAPSIPPDEFRERQRRAAEATKERGFDGLLVWSRGGTSVDFYGDVMYLTNHHSPFPPNQDTTQWSGRSFSALVLPTEGEPTIVVDLPDPPLDQIYVEDVRPTLRVPQTAAQGLLRREEALASQVAADQLDELLRQVRDVADGLVSDRAALAVGAAQQVADVLPARAAHPAVGDDVDRPTSARHDWTMTGRSDGTQASLMTTQRQMQPTAKPLPLRDQRLRRPRLVRELRPRSTCPRSTPIHRWCW